MKVSTFLILMILIAGIFFIFSEATREANEQYPEANIDSSEWSSKYDYSTELSSSIEPLKEKISLIEDTNTGWWTKITSGIAAIPYAVILVPRVTFSSLVFGGKIVTGFFTAMKLPAKVVSLVLLIISIWAIFKIVGFFQRSEI